MNKRNVFLIILLSIAIILGSFQIFGIVENYFSQGEVLAKSNSLEIEYWIDSDVEEVNKKQDSESFLAQLRNRKSGDEKLDKTDIEEIEDVETVANENKKSLWEKLLESREKDRRDAQNPVLKKAKKDKIDEEKKVEEEIVNKFQEEVNKSRENAKKRSEENGKDKGESKDKDKDSKSIQEEQRKAIEKAKKEKERKEREQKEKDKKENIVTMHIRCDTAVAKGMADDPKWQGIVPKSGVILATTKFKIKEGDTVLDVLIMAKEQYKFQMSYRGNEASAYIEGINNLYEFDGGRWSGWMYSVNGWYPNYGAGVYVLKGGDVIEWNYTCDLGKDLGQDWLGD